MHPGVRHRFLDHGVVFLPLALSPDSPKRQGTTGRCTSGSSMTFRACCKSAGRAGFPALLRAVLRIPESPFTKYDREYHRNPTRDLSWFGCIVIALIRAIRRTPRCTSIIPVAGIAVWRHGGAVRRHAPVCETPLRFQSACPKGFLRFWINNLQAFLSLFPPAMPAASW